MDLTKRDIRTNASHDENKLKYTSKVSYMVNLILKLKEEDNNGGGDVNATGQGNKEEIKILIFSERLAILNAIAIALKDNNIKYRCQHTVKHIADFKVHFIVRPITW